MSERNVSLENLEIWRRAATENRALRLLQIAEAAGSALSDLTSIADEGLRLPLSDLDLQAGTIFDTALALDEQMAFFRARLQADAPMPSVGKLRQAPASPKVARLAGTVFDEAFRRFWPMPSKARPLYVSSLSELLEELASGAADFALIPIEDSKGSRFLHFYEDFDRLELHVICLCNVQSDETGASIRFALLSKQFLPPKTTDGEQLLEYRLSGQDTGALTKLLMAAENASLRLCRIDTLPDPSFEGGYTYHVILAVEQTAQAALLHAYLTEALPRAVLVGTYIDLKEGK